MSEPALNAPHELMTTAVPEPALTDIARLADDCYGLRGDITLLGGERDCNARIRGDQGDWVLKFINPAEDPLVTGFQTQMLLHLERLDRTLPVPKVRVALDGAVEPVVHLQGRRLALRCVSYLPGVPQHLASPSAATMHELGDTLARLDLALVSFHHPGAHRDLLWDIGHAERVQPYVDCLPDSQRAPIERFMQRFIEQVRPRLAGLRAQVIHNDLNPHNVMLDSETEPRVAALIDFGDALHGPLVNELGTALAYQVDAQAADPLWRVAPFLAAYHARLPLREEELALLGDLIVTRMALAITIAQWRATLYPGNRDYILRNLPASWRNLQCLLALPDHHLTRQLRAACLGNTP